MLNAQGEHAGSPRAFQCENPIHVALGDPSEALRWLGRAYAVRDDELVYLRIDETFEPLRADPAFPDLIRRIGIPDRFQLALFWPANFHFN